MKSFCSITSAAVFTLAAVILQAQQSVSIGTTTIDPNAVLLLVGNGAQGLIIPQTNNIVNMPVKEGMVVYNTIDNKVYYCDGSNWKAISEGSSSGSAQTLTLNGNTISISGGNTIQLATSPAANSFYMWNGSSWVATSLIGDISSTNGNVTVNAVKGKAIPTLPNSAQALVYDGTNWVFQSLATGLSNSLNNGSMYVGNSSNTATAVAMSGHATLSNTGVVTIANNAITSAKIEDGAITASDLNSMGATTAGQVLRWNGAGWAPGVTSGLSSTLNAGQIYVGNATNIGTAVAMSGDATLSNAGALTLANSGVTANTYGSTTQIPQLTVDAKGRITAVTNQSIATATGTTTGLLSSADFTTFSNKVSSITAGTGITIGGTTTAPSVGLNTTGVIANTYGSTTQVPQFTVDAQGRITGVTNVTIAGATFGNLTSANTEINITGGVGAVAGSGTAINIQNATTSQGGLLTATDWNIFNNKLGTGTTAGGDLAGTYPNPTLATSGVTAGSYGTSTSVSQLTVDAKGRITAASSVAIPTSNGTTTGLLTGADFTTFTNKLGTTTAPAAGDVAGNFSAGLQINANAVTTAEIADGSVTTAKLSPTGASNGQILKYNGTVWTLAADDVGAGSVPTLSSGQILIGDGTNNAAAALSGDATLAAGVITLANSASTRTNLGLGTLATASTVTSAEITNGTITSADIANNTITNANILAAAGITVDKLAPGTNGQILTTSGGVATWGAGFTNPMTTPGDIIYGGASGVTTRLATGTGFLRGGATPAYSAVGLASADVTGTLPIANGGTNATTAAAALTNLGALGTALTSANIFVGSPGNVATGVTLTGDAGITNTGVLTIGTGVVTSTKILDATITDADINGSGITTAGKVSGGAITSGTIGGSTSINTTGNITTTGTLNTGAATVSALTIGSTTIGWPANSPGVLTNNGTGTLTWASGSGWGLTGNNILATPTNFIGTTSNNDLILKTNNTEYARLTATGNMGIGTTTPGGQLHVNSAGITEVQVTSSGSSSGLSIDGNGTNFSYVNYLANGATKFGTGSSNAGNFYYIDGTSGSYTGLNVTTTNNVGIGTSTPASKLDVAGDVHLAQGAAPGVVTDKLYNVSGNLYWNGTNISSAGSGWGLTGNGSIVDGTHFIGTTTDVPLTFRVNSLQAGRLESLSGNAFWGYQAGLANTGSYNTGIGAGALQSNTGASQNVAVGNAALQSSTGGLNTAVGQAAMILNTSGVGNTALGNYALHDNTAGANNTAIGRDALFNVTGDGNTGVGYLALGSAGSSTNSTAIGNSATVSSGLTNATAIGYSALASASNTIVLGGTGANAVNVGIGTTTPLSELQIGTHLGIFNDPGQGNDIISRGIYFDGTDYRNISSTASSALLFSNERIGMFTFPAGGAGAISPGPNSMRVNLRPSGFGIGVDTPEEALDVDGPVYLRDLGGAPGTPAERLYNIGTTLYWNGAPIGGASGFNLLNQVPRGDGTSTVSSNIYSNGTNVSIGTSTFSYPLALEANTAGYMAYYKNLNSGAYSKLVLDGTGTGGGYLSLNSGGPEKGFMYTDGTHTLLGSSGGSAGELRLFSNGTQRMLVDAGGNVGIGLTIPQSLLHVNGSATGSIRITNDAIGTSATDGLYLNINNTGLATINTGENQNLSLGANGNGVLFLTPGGLAGFNQNNPTAGIDLNGTIKIVDGTQGAGKVLTSDANGLASWQTPNGGGWGLTGNSGTTAGTNFIGTTDAQDLVFKTGTPSGVERMRIGGTPSAAGNLLNVTNNGFGTGLRIESSGGGSTMTAMYGLSNNATSSIGVAGEAISSGTTTVGLWGNAQSSGTSGTAYGVLAGATSTSTSVQSIAVSGFATGAGINKAIRGSASGGTENWAGFFEGDVHATGNVGIGTTTPAQALDVTGYVRVAAGTGASNEGLLLATPAAGTSLISAGGRATTMFTISQTNNAPMNFLTSGLERMRIDGAGNVGIGITAPTTDLHVGHLNGSPGAGDGFTIQNMAGAQTFNFFVSNATGNLVFYENGTLVGQFAASNGTYSPVSDKRLKKNIVDMEGVLPMISEIKIKRYHFKKQADSELSNIGVIAQDLKTVYPELVHYNPEADRYSVDYSGLSTLAIKAIQEQQEMIKSLKAKIEQLESSLNTEKSLSGNLNSKVERLEANMEMIIKSLGLDIKAKKQ